MDTGTETKQQILSTDDAAREISCSVRQVVNLIREGQLKATRVGLRTFAILRADLDAYLATKSPPAGVQSE